MNYIELTIPCNDEATIELYIALLSNYGFEGFAEEDNVLRAYLPEQDYEKEELNQFLNIHNIVATSHLIPKTNWNSQWEENFEPIQVDNFCGIRASFHAPITDVAHEIVITPKMSFGTGHHATTQMMIKLMQQLHFDGKKVFDFGCGTGILAILASKLQASSIIAVDHEEWACENALENAKVNNTDIVVIEGSMEQVADRDFDIILANINRNILLQYMQDLAFKTKKDGVILMSGLLLEDKNIIVSAAAAEGIIFDTELALNGWIALLFHKGK